MTTDPSRSAGNRSIALRRRTLLSAAAGGLFLGATGVTAADDGDFPPEGITRYGREIDLGDGHVRTFTSQTPSGEPVYHGVEFDRAALDGLPSGGDLKNADNRDEDDKYRAGGQASEVHFKQSLQFFVPFPEAAATPFTFLGLNWNPGGHHGGAGAWLKPHFDIHFHMLDTETVDDIEGPRLPPYDESNGEYTDNGPGPDPTGAIVGTNFDYDQLPAGYARSPDPVADERYITDMGEHAAPVDAPELPAAPGEPGNPEAFDNTLIQGFAGDEDGSRLSFVEPMITAEFLRNVEETMVYEIPQPETYPHEKQHPQRYSVRRDPSTDTIAVALQQFEQV